jgi:hypothetical protein
LYEKEDTLATQVLSNSFSSKKHFLKFHFFVDRINSLTSTSKKAAILRNIGAVGCVWLLHHFDSANFPTPK